MVDLTLGDSAAIIAEAKARGVLRNQLAYILATAKWETAHTMKPVIEAYWKPEEWRANNLRYYPWHGRGYVQLTWRDNYKRAQEKLGLGTLLTDDPNAALRADVAAKVLVHGMMDGWFTGKKLGDYVDLSKSDFQGARRVVNGTDKADAIAKIAMAYDKALKAAGYGESKPQSNPFAALIAVLRAIFGGRK